MIDIKPKSDNSGSGYFPNLNKTSKPDRSKQLLKSQILEVQNTARSAAEAARILGVAFNTYKKYAKLYGVYENLLNPSATGIPKRFTTRNRKYHLDDLLKGKYLEYPLKFFKKKLFESGAIPCVCSSCGFSEARITDGKYPLLLDFMDGDLKNRKIENLRPLCYNCYFLLVGERRGYKWYKENGYNDKLTHIVDPFTGEISADQKKEDNN